MSLGMFVPMFVGICLVIIYVNAFFATMKFISVSIKELSHNDNAKTFIKKGKTQVSTSKFLITDAGLKKLNNASEAFLTSQNIEEKVKEVELKKNLKQINNSFYTFDGADPKDAFYKKFSGLSPEEVLELNKAANDKFSHDVYHASNNTVHNPNGVYFVYDQTEQTYYWGESTNILKLICKLLKTSGNPIYKAYKQGNSLRIKLLVPDGEVFRSNKEIIADLRIRYLK